MNVLGIETSCDETAAAVVTAGRTVRANVVFSQVHLHQPYGGVVPEIASRNHLTQLPGVIENALAQSGLKWPQIDAVAVTYGPGLASSLLVGLFAAKGLAVRLKIPLVGINHLAAHVYSPALAPGGPDFRAMCPLVVLMVSGGHTCLIRADAPGRYRLLGWTLDDAAGEAFDKGANLLGLGYPGGPAIDRVAEGGDPRRVEFPRGQISGRASILDSIERDKPLKSKIGHACSRPALPGRRIIESSDTATERRGYNLSPLIANGIHSELCFSFSGLKTALLYRLKAHPCPPGSPELAHLAASYQEAIVDALVERLRLAVNREGVRCMAAVGGVSLNRRLRDKLQRLAETMGIRLFLPQPDYCVDNAAMVAGLAGIGQGVCGPDAMALDAEPNLEIGVVQKRTE